MELVDLLKVTENKVSHLHKTIDHISTEPDFKESVAVLTEIIQDYQTEIDKVKHTLESVQFGQGQNQSQGQGQNQNNGQNQSQNQKQPQS
nr:hypothetical protein [Brevibacillus fulvus]